MAGGLAGLIGLVTLSQYVLGVDLGIDQLVFDDRPGALSTSHAGRMAPNAAIAFSLIGTALALPDARVARRFWVANWLAIAGGGIGVVAFIAYSSRATTSTGLGGLSHMALSTAVVFVTLGLGCLLGRPDRGAMELVTSDTAAGRLIRVLMPMAILVPVALDLVRNAGEELGLFGPAIGAWLLVTGIVTLSTPAVWFLARSISVVDEEGERAYASAVELTQELGKARDEALEAAKSRSDFLANMSHEIRTPLNGVIGMNELLLETRLDTQQREYVETARSSGESLLLLVNDVLDYSKIEAGKLELDRAGFGLRGTIEEAVSPLVRSAFERKLELAVSIDERLPAVLLGDEGRLRQVVSNLVSNAVKFTHEGEVVVRARHAGEGEGKGKGKGTIVVRVEVSDTGIGIEEARLGGLFDYFVQADASTTRKYGGTGLGLAISSQLVGRMGGEMGAESTPGKGSTFWFTVTLPVVRGLGTKGPQHPELAGLGVLVVDDNDTNREILDEELRAFDMRVESVVDGAGALEALAAAQRRGALPDVAVVDHHMPGMDGVALAHAIRTRRELASVQLVLLSSSPRVDDSGPDRAFSAVLTKPVRQARLLEALRTVVYSSRRAGAATARPAARSAPTAPAIAPDVQADRAAGELEPASERLVLLVEDNKVNQMVATKLLEDRGCRVHVADDGQKALDMLERRPYSVVFMDCQLPLLDGYEATREIRRREGHGPRRPVVAMTAHSMPGDRERCLAVGMDDYLSKPIRPAELDAALERWLRHGVAASRLGPTAPADGEQGGSTDPELFDPAELEDVREGDSDLYLRLLRMFVDESAGRVAAIRESLSSGDWQGVREAAHSVKGSSASVGAVRMSARAKDVEMLGRAEDMAVHEELVGLEHAYEATRELLDAPDGPLDGLHDAAAH